LGGGKGRAPRTDSRREERREEEKGVKDIKKLFLLP